MLESPKFRRLRRSRKKIAECRYNGRRIDTALHIPPAAMSTALMAAEGEAFLVNQYRRIKACILHSMESRLSAIAPKPDVISRMSL